MLQQGWACSSVVEGLSTTHQALRLIPITKKVKIVRSLFIIATHAQPIIRRRIKTLHINGLLNKNDKLLTHTSKSTLKTH